MHTLVPHDSPQHRRENGLYLTSILAHADLLFKNVTETFARIEKVQSTIYKLYKERTSF